MSSVVLVVRSERADVSTIVGSGGKETVTRIVNLLDGGLVGAANLRVDAHYSATNPVAASGTVTCASVAADDTVTIGATTLTAKASPSGESQFSQAGSDSADATDLAAKINAHSVLSKLVSASAVGAVVTVTLLVKGSVGNHVPLTTSNGTRLAATGSGFLASGTGGAESAAVAVSLGL